MSSPPVSPVAARRRRLKPAAGAAGAAGTAAGGVSGVGVAGAVVPPSVRVVPVLWRSGNAARAWCESVQLAWACVWVVVFGWVVVSGVYMTWGDLGYLGISLFVAVPHVLLPAALSWASGRPEADAGPALGVLLRLLGPDPEALAGVPWTRRYWVKANAWHFVFGFVGNYLWTHYFFVVLRATYEFPVSLELNDVPVIMYLLTHGYFSFYHCVMCMCLRRWMRTRFYRRTLAPGFAQSAATALVVFVLGVVTAFGESFTIQSVPYYKFEDKWRMFTLGSAFYGIYFYFSFPMFLRLDENPHLSPSKPQQHPRWSLSHAIMHAAAATMGVTITLDLTRLALGAAGGQGLPWLQ